jgi:hypothetical protein
MRPITVLFVSGVAIMLAGIAAAEKVDTPPKGLFAGATHVIQGKVTAVYDRQETVGSWRYTRYCAEVLITKVEKGKGLAAKGLVYARYWKRRWVGPGDMPPSTNGHRGLPKAGETLRIYLAKNAYDGFSNENTDGGFNVLGANGFEKLP